MISIARRFLNANPRLKSFVKDVLGIRSPASVSTNYVELDADELDTVGKDLQGAWQNDSLPARQRKLVEEQLKQYRAGSEVRVFDVLVDSIRRLRLGGIPSLLEVGCSSGYYSEVLPARGVAVRYAGCDYSEAFIELARRCYPALRFDVMDATRLGYRDGEFDIVVSASCILHILDYPAAIAETARVAGRFAIFHRTPVQHGKPTRHYTKDAYGVQTIELHFNETELVRLFADNGLVVTDILTIDAEWRKDDAFAMKTYVCRKVA
jgi:SAM-dependent methyltransferase